MEKWLGAHTVYSLREESDQNQDLLRLETEPGDLQHTHTLSLTHTHTNTP